MELSTRNVIDSNKTKFLTSFYFKESRIKEDKYDVQFYGNETAYNELILYYSYNKLRIDEILPYTLIMVERHKKFNYCTNVVENIIQFYTNKSSNQYIDGTDKGIFEYLKLLKLLDVATKQYCLNYVTLGASNNDPLSLKYLEVLYRNGLILDKNINKADILKEKYEQLSSLPKI
ncbi:hypothetical protein [Flavobacterium branchiophilum]|nr:hypothetical protein [Flavobacterium branchiophilum]